jgi:hypothetical protein
MFTDPLTASLAAFVREVGIDVHAATLDNQTFLPGLDIRYGAILVDEARLAYPGDLLHEAGHIAVADPDARREEKLSPSDGDEFAAIAWSYAAAVKLGIDPRIVFHAGGYRGWSTAYVENFTAGRYVGVPLLQLYGMAIEPPRRAGERRSEAYPHMLRWLR